MQFGRYTALGLGLLWGSHRYKVNKATEDAWREEDAKLKVIRDAKKAEEKQRLNREELIYLAGQAGVKVSADFQTISKESPVHQLYTQSAVNT